MAPATTIILVLFYLFTLKGEIIYAANTREFAPIITVPESRAGQALGHTMNFACLVHGNPVPATYWLKNGKEIANDKHYRISRFSTSDSEPDSFLLRIEKIEKQHYGKYTCRATNSLGSAEGFAELYETQTAGCSFTRCE